MMRIVRGIAQWPEAARGAVMALGNFDGVHRGHQAIVQETVAIARDRGKPAAVMTFEPHPRVFFDPALAPYRIEPFRCKAARLRALGIDVLLVMRFDASLSQMPAGAFIDEVLVDRLAVSHLVVGKDFIFGKDRGGSTRILYEQASRHGFGFTQAGPVMVQAARCSSTAIRESLRRGEVREAARLLGRPYAVSGRVRTGDRRGRTLGFPTANLALPDILAPKFGVYAVRVTGPALPGVIEGVANLGVRPTFDGSVPLLEVHLFDYDGDLYGARLEVALIDFIRKEQAFDGIEALKAQIVRDADSARKILHALS